MSSETVDNWVEPRIRPEMLKIMAIEYAEKRAWLDRDIPQDTHSMSFFILNFMDDDERKRLREHPPAAIYGHGDNQLGRAVNGFPMFTEVTFMYRQDFEIFIDLTKKLIDAKAAILAII